MSIRVKFVVACLVCALIPLVGYAAYTYVRTVEHLDRLENDQLAAREIAVGQALDDVVSTELANVGDTAGWAAFVDATRRRDVGWLRRELGALPDVAAGGVAQVLTTGGRLLLSVGSSRAESLWLVPEAQRVTMSNAPAAGYESVDGTLSLVAARHVKSEGGGGEPAGLLIATRPVDREMLDTIGTYAGVRVDVAPADVVEKLSTATTSAQAGSGVLSQVGDTFVEGDTRGAYLAVYDADGYRSGLVEIAMERTAVSGAVADIRTMALIALLVAAAVAVLAALFVSRRISRPLQELAAAAAGIAAGETRQEIHVSGGDEVGQLAAAFATMSERVTERVTDLSEKIRSLTEELIDLNVVFGETLADTVDVQAELGHMIPRVATMMKADVACLYLVPEGGGPPTFATASCESAPERPELEEAARRALADAAPYVTDEAAIAGDAAPAAGTAPAVAGAESGVAAVAGAVVAVPLTRAGKVTGALVVRRGSRAFGAEDLALLSALGGQVAMAAQNAETYHRLEGSYLSTVTALASAIEAKEDYTADHCRLIAGMAETVGRRLEQDERDLRLLRYAAILHDVGKTGVPESILRTPGRLADDQLELVAEHTVIGESIVGRIQYLRPIAPILRSAHERWDGHGYPDRLRGEEIPLAARIVFVCDAYHAMTSDRPYRKALSPEAALEELRENAGGQFDPDVVQAFADSRDAIARLFGAGAHGAQLVDRVLATVLVTDIVGSTAKAAELGDSAWHELLDRHRAKVRALLKRYRGAEIDAAGDGFLATFDGAARAVQCAAAVGPELAPLGLEVRAGCHCGEVDVTGAGVGGIAVHAGARICALAGPGEVFVSSVVRELVTGSGLAFDERGEHELKGVPGLWRLYALRRSAQP